MDCMNEFQSVLSEIHKILASCTVTDGNDGCLSCGNDIKEHENKLTCESCHSHYHVTCMVLQCSQGIANVRLIWICAKCVSDNIAHSIFDAIGIPSHPIRYEPLQCDIDGEEAEIDEQECYTSTKNDWKPRFARKKKRSKEYWYTVV
ncbi:uncharacterized protein [Diadema antillarum]|uniref:uncharacterized protein n=1 Tax=Diadema antillarum TaxID=105358 RepID=UPI003A878B72